jgi:DNA-directed RNA polymerase I, II, and III subunit RPABC2
MSINYENSDSDDEIFTKNKNTKLSIVSHPTYFSDDDSSEDNSDVESEIDDFKGGAEDIEEGEVEEGEVEEGEVEEGEVEEVEENNKDEDEDEDEYEEDDDDEDENINIDDTSEYGESIDTNKEKKNVGKKKSQKTKASNKTIQLPMDEDYDDDEDEEYNESYLQKFDSEISKNYVDEFHPECFIHNYDEIIKLSVVVRDNFGIIIDPLHKTIPYLTKYERARVLGQRAKQIEYGKNLENGSKPFVKVPENVVDGYVIAELELQQKKIPFIIRRPIPSGGFEYWSIKDLEIISF